MTRMAIMEASNTIGMASVLPPRYVQLSVKQKLLCNQCAKACCCEDSPNGLRLAACSPNPITFDCWAIVKRVCSGDLTTRENKTANTISATAYFSMRKASLRLERQLLINHHVCGGISTLLSTLKPTYYEVSWSWACPKSCQMFQQRPCSLDHQVWVTREGVVQFDCRRWSASVWLLSIWLSICIVLCADASRSSAGLGIARGTARKDEPG